MRSSDGVGQLRGIGDSLSQRFAKLGISVLSDLIDYYPRRYEDYSHITPIQDLRPGTVTVKAVLQQVAGHYTHRGFHVTEAIATDKTASVRVVWFHQPYRASSIKPGRDYFISGSFELSYQRFAILNPSIELVSEFPINTARIVPIYRETKGLTSRQIRAGLEQVIPLMRSLPETLPAWLISQHGLMSRAEAIKALHFPNTSQQLRQAHSRLGFDELFAISLASLMNKYEIAQEHAPAVPFEERVAKQFVSHLPFQLTDSQRKTIWQIYLDMQKTQPMNRLVEGDVGSGKTVVAAMAAVMVLHHGHQVALMAPTEILARQHANTISQLLKPLGLDAQVGLLVGSMTATQKQRAHQSIAGGAMQFIIGTHTVLEDKVAMHNLELIIIDEQHRFGVEQRKALIAKAGHMPHVLNLTATPIPRSLALTLYGELDVSILDAKPAGRQPVTTAICSPNSRKQLYAQIERELTSGRQLFVVCPLITDSETTKGSSAEAIYEQFAEKDFKSYQVGLLHGKMKAVDKTAVMQAFVDHKLDILVSTTVIEVGVDVPNASVMLIEAADRFGLAQIHQLRGRIGRGEHPGYCYLMMSDSRPASARLRALERSNDGFKLAELDLQLRGPGAIYGTMQHGQLDLRVANLSDSKLIVQVRRAAQAFIDRNEAVSGYPELEQRVKHLRAVTNLN